MMWNDRCENYDGVAGPASPIDAVISNEATIFHRGEKRNLLNLCMRHNRWLGAAIGLVAMVREIPPLRFAALHSVRNDTTIGLFFNDLLHRFIAFIIYQLQQVHAGG